MLFISIGEIIWTEYVNEDESVRKQMEASIKCEGKTFQGTFQRVI